LYPLSAFRAMNRRRRRRLRKSCAPRATQNGPNRQSNAGGTLRTARLPRLREKLDGPVAKQKTPRNRNEHPRSPLSRSTPKKARGLVRRGRGQHRALLVVTSGNDLHSIGYDILELAAQWRFRKRWRPLPSHLRGLPTAGRTRRLQEEAAKIASGSSAAWASAPCLEALSSTALQWTCCAPESSALGCVCPKGKFMTPPALATIMIALWPR